MADESVRTHWPPPLFNQLTPRHKRRGKGLEEPEFKGSNCVHSRAFPPYAVTMESSWHSLILCHTITGKYIYIQRDTYGYFLCWCCAFTKVDICTPGIFVHIITRHEWQLFIDRTAVHSFIFIRALIVLRSTTFILCCSKNVVKIERYLQLKY